MNLDPSQPLTKSATTSQQLNPASQRLLPMSEPATIQVSNYLNRQLSQSATIGGVWWGGAGQHTLADGLTLSKLPT